PFNFHLSLHVYIMATSAPSMATSAPSASDPILQCRLSDVSNWNVVAPAAAPFPQVTTCDVTQKQWDISTVFPYVEETDIDCKISTHTCVSGFYNVTGSTFPNATLATFDLAVGCVLNNQVDPLKLALTSICGQIDACKANNPGGKPDGGFEECNSLNCNSCTPFGAAGIVGPSLLLVATMFGGLASFFSF
ncbi:hypothetical protein TrRE_jg1232, partial [Triparma retinervis]